MRVKQVKMRQNPTPGPDARWLSPAVSAVGEARVGPLIELPRVLEELGLSPRRVLRQAGVAPGLFSNPENRIPYEALGELLSTCASLSGRGDFGLLAGSRFSLANFGTLGDLMRNAGTVGEALRALILHLHFYDRTAVPVMFRVGSARVLLGYSPQHAAMPGAGQLQDAAITVAYRMMRELCGAGWQPEFVQFSHHRPDSIAGYRRVFGPGVRFNADLSGLSFSSASLEHPVAGADPALYTLLTHTLRDAKAGGLMSVAEEVRCVLLQLLPGGTAATASVARMFGISERTLRQKLQDEGVKMQQLLAETRFELARHLLHNTQLPMADIAAALCYADAAVFSRAFHSWAGISPRQWRYQSQAPGRSGRSPATPAR